MSFRHLVLTVLSACLVALPARAATWRGLEPGVSKGEDVERLLGAPTRTLTRKTHVLLAYLGTQAPAETREVQLQVDSATGVVERIDVFPRPTPERASLEAEYGPACATTRQTTSCHTIRGKSGGRAYLSYGAQGLAVFLEADQKKVRSITFLPTPASARPSPPAVSSSPAPTPPPPPAPEVAEDKAPETGTSGTAETGTSSESTLAEGTGDEELGNLIQVSDPLKIGGEVLLRGQVRTERQGTRLSDSYTAPAIVDTYLDARPNDRLRAMVTGRLTYDPTRSSDTSANNPGVLLDQLWLRFDLGHTVFVTAGKQKVKWGTANLWNPTDFVSPQQRELLVTYDLRVGTNMVKLHVPWESQGANFYVLGLVDREGPEDKPLRMGGAVRAELVLGGAEFSLTGVKRQGQKARVGLDVSTALGPLDVYVEAAARQGVDAPLYRLRPDVPAEAPLAERIEATSPEGWQPAVSGGVYWERSLRDRYNVMLGVEYFYDATGYTEPEVLPWLMLQGRYVPFYAGSQYAAAQVRFSYSDGVDSNSVMLSTVANVVDRSMLARLDAAFMLLGALTVETFVSVPLGREGGEFRPSFDLPDSSVRPAFFEAGLGFRLRL
jgi:hypothetical protein